MKGSQYPIKKTLLYSNILENPNERTLVWQHDPKNPIGKATLREDDTGLRDPAGSPANISRCRCKELVFFVTLTDDRYAGILTGG